MFKFLSPYYFSVIRPRENRGLKIYKSLYVIRSDLWKTIRCLDGGVCHFRMLAGLSIVSKSNRSTNIRTSYLANVCPANPNLQ